MLMAIRPGRCCVSTEKVRPAAGQRSRPVLPCRLSQFPCSSPTGQTRDYEGLAVQHMISTHNGNTPAAFSLFLQVSEWSVNLVSLPLFLSPIGDRTGGKVSLVTGPPWASVQLCPAGAALSTTHRRTRPTCRPCTYTYVSACMWLAYLRTSSCSGARSALQCWGSSRLRCGIQASQ